MEKVEVQFESPILNGGLDVLETVNEAYDKISKTMFESLQAIAKDTTSHQASGSKDDDDKEQLNSHISMIENMHYYCEAVDDRGNTTLINSKSKARALLDEHLTLYLKIVIRRPLGRLLVHDAVCARLIITGFPTGRGNIHSIKPIGRCNSTDILFEISF